MVVPMRDMSDVSLSSIASMLDMTFGAEDSNVVDFRIMYAILLLLGRSMRVLERQVFIKTQAFHSNLESTMSIIEVKIRGKGKKKGQKGKEAKGTSGFDSDESYSSEDEEVDEGKRQKRLGQGKQGKDEDDNEYKKEGKYRRGREADQSERQGAGQQGKKDAYPDLDDGRRARKRQKGDDDEMVTEKLLIVELTPSGEGFISPTSGLRRPMSIATKEDYHRLLAQVMELQKRFGPIDIPGFEILEAMYQQTVLSDPVSILQLSARLEYTERAINEIYSLLLGLAGLPPQQILQGVSAGGGSYGFQGGPGAAFGAQAGPGAAFGSQGGPGAGFGAQSGPGTGYGAQGGPGAGYDAQGGPGAGYGAQGGPGAGYDAQGGPGAGYDAQGGPGAGYGAQAGPGAAFGTQGGPFAAFLAQGGLGTPFGAQAGPGFGRKTGAFGPKAVSDVMTLSELEMIRSEFFDEEILEVPADSSSFVEPEQFRARLENAKHNFPKVCIGPNNKAQVSALQTISAVEDMAKRMLKTDNINNRVNEAEETIINYGLTVTDMDTEYVEVVNAYQEELTEMQQTLEAAVDYMSEALTSRVPDTDAIDELNRLFNMFEVDLESTFDVQLHLNRLQETMEDNLVSLAEEVKEVQEKKCTRQEVKDALAVKANVGDLNGKISRDQFVAIFGELENNVTMAYDKFNNQEFFWQKCIDDLDQECRQKPHKWQVECLRLDILDKLSTLTDRLDFMIEIASAYSNDTAMEPRQLIRVEDCISCGTEVPRPAEQPIKKAPIKPKEYSESSISVRKQSIVKTIVESDGGGDTKPPVCYPTGKVEHPVAQRTKDMRKCKRICGERFRRPDFPIDIKILRREYILSHKPCVPCNPPPPVRKPSRRARRLEAEKSVILQKAESEVMEEGLGEEEQLPEVGSAGSLEKFLKYSMYFGPELIEEITGPDAENELNEGDDATKLSSRRLEGKSSLHQGSRLEGKSSMREVVKLERQPSDRLKPDAKPTE